RQWTFEPAAGDAAAGERWVRVPVEFSPDAAPASTGGPRALERTPPAYPSGPLAAGIGGRVVLKVLVGADGSVKQVEVESSEPAGVFDEATVEAVRQWRFEPMRRDGVPVEGWLRVPVDFDPSPEG
ncbi:MAG: energy transducer TonB, partial [Gammaproteobacteria bacterium]|nr:energy transducer TonB [Gammaproteobacteria bacterium]